MKQEQRRNLWQVAALFLKMSVISFGGPAAHIALMEEEVVNRRRWLTREHFLDLVGATNLIPGPNATEMAIHVGFIRAGWPGLILAGVCFIVPAALITLGFGWAYVRYGALPEVAPFLYGIKPAILSIIILAMYRLGKTAVKGWPVLLIGLVVLAASLLGLNEIVRAIRRRHPRHDLAALDEHAKGESAAAFHALSFWPGLFFSGGKRAASRRRDIALESWPFLPEGRRGALWQWLCAHRLFAGWAGA